MPKLNWKSLLLIGSVATVGTGLLMFAIVSLVKLEPLGWSGLLSFVLLLVLTVVSSRFTVPVTNLDGVSQTHKSVADAFIFFAVMTYTLSPANSLGPAVILAATVGLISSFHFAQRRTTLFSVSTSVISTFVASLVYRVMALSLMGGAMTGNETDLVLNFLLFPLCVFGIVQYSLSTFGTIAFNSFCAGEARLTVSPESLVWTLITQVANVTSAAMFYAAIHGAGVAFLFVGVLIIVLVHLLYRFNEKRVSEVTRGQAEKLRYIEEIANLHMNTIESLAIAIDAKDQTTHGHVRRTQIYGTEMGKLLKVGDEELRALVAGALLHDIGKLAVPEYILNKPGKLTESEFAKMKIHPTVGGDILRRVNFPYPVEDVVRYHHEKWDGSGYPKGLRGEGIPLVARIISVVDFYDATRCDRPYRKGMKREESLGLLQTMAGSAFDPHIVGKFVEHVVEFDKLIDAEDIQEQVASETDASDYHTKTKPDAGLASDVLGSPHDSNGFRSITQAQREVFALHEIAQTIGSSLNLNDTVSLVSNKLRAIVPFETCLIFVVNDRSGKATAIHAAGENGELFKSRRMNVGDGITGWVIANGRSMSNASPELDLVGVADEIVRQYRAALVSPLLREDGAFGAITLYSKTHTSYTTEHVRLLESVCQHASSALNNAMTYERTRESALMDPLTELPNARGFYMMLEQRIAEGQRMNKESLAVLSMDIDDFKAINDEYGHATGDRVLASLAGVMRKELRQMDILTRYAGDEFVAIMPMASSSIARSVGERVRTAVEGSRYSVRAGKMVELELSLGVACFPDDGQTTEELLTAAARRMQRDKHARKTVFTLVNTPVGAVY